MNTLRNDLIKAALTGLCANPAYTNEESELLAELAILRADATLARINAAESPITGSAEVDWSQAPAEANWHAWEGGGHGYWFSSNPRWIENGEYWCPGDDEMLDFPPSFIPKPDNLAARDSLTRRPGK